MKKQPTIDISRFNLDKTNSFKALLSYDVINPRKYAFEEIAGFSMDNIREIQRDNILSSEKYIQAIDQIFEEPENYNFLYDPDTRAYLYSRFENHINFLKEDLLEHSRQNFIF